MALESSQKIADEEHVYGQHTLRDNGGKASGPATLIHEIESPIVVNDLDETTNQDSPLKLYNSAF